MRAPSIRTRGGAIETAVNAYRHTSGHIVTLVGTIHVASSRYFDELRALLVGADEAGSVVHYEFIRKADDEALAAASEVERDAVARLRAVKMTKVLADLIGLPTQHVILPLPEHWRNVDVTDLDVVRAHADDLSFIDGMEKSAESFKDLDDTQRKVLRWLTLFALRHIQGVRYLASALKAMRLSPPSMRDEFVLDHRNRLAIDAALAEPGQVVLAWGAGHLPGMHTLLIKAGYRLEATRWLTALRQDEELPVGERQETT